MTLLHGASRSTCTRRTVVMQGEKIQNCTTVPCILPGSLLENIVNSSWVMSQKHRGHTSEPRCPALHTHQVQFIAPSPKRLHRTDHQYPQKAWRLPANSKRDTRPQSLSQDGRGWLLRGQVTDQSFLGLKTTEKVHRLFHRASNQHHS